jgi:hypothetical protein
VQLNGEPFAGTAYVFAFSDAQFNNMVNHAVINNGNWIMTIEPFAFDTTLYFAVYAYIGKEQVMDTGITRTVRNQNVSGINLGIQNIISTNIVTIEFSGFGAEYINLTASDTYLRLGDSLTITVTGNYDSYQWLLNGSFQTWSGYEITYTIPHNAHSLVGRNNTIAVFVTRNGVPYSKEVTFMVQE